LSPPRAAGRPLARFAVADELTCYYDRPAEPANVHVEAHVDGRLDESVVRAAVGALLGAEEGLRARQAGTGRWRPAYYWEFPAAADTDPVRVATYTDAADLARLRSDFLSASPPLRTSPPLRLLLASGTDADAGDVLVLNAHHAHFDGLSALRLLRGVASRYEELSSPPQPLGARAAGAGASTGSAGGADSAGSGPAGDARSAAARSSDLPPDDPPQPPPVPRGRITRIAGEREPGTPVGLPGYGALLLTWDGLADAAAFRSSAGGSVNDLLIATLMVAIGEWNAAHGAPAGLVQVTMPVGEPVQATAAGQWANRSRLTKVSATVRPGCTVADLLGTVAAQASYAKRQPGAQVDGVSRALTVVPIPVAVKRAALRAAVRTIGQFASDSCLVSNLGVVAPVSFGPAGTARLWFSTSAHMPRGLSLGVVTTGDDLALTFRYRLALFSPAAAADFAGRYVRTLDAVVGRRVPA
jgi:NRPS condensation-like uncharacterized protein